MAEYLAFPEPEDYIIRITDSIEHDVEYHIFDNSGMLRRNLGSTAVAAMQEGIQPWADFAFMEAIEQPAFRFGDIQQPIVLDQEGYRIYTSPTGMFVRYRDEAPEETLDRVIGLYPDLRFTQRDVAFQYELTFGERFRPHLQSEREHAQLGTYNADGSFTPFLTLLDWAHPVMPSQE